MVLAYVLVSTKDEDPRRTANAIISGDNVSSVHLIYGEWDIIARVKADDLITLREVSLERIKRIKGVSKTTTLIVADETNPGDNPPPVEEE